MIYSKLSAALLYCGAEVGSFGLIM
jgi:hypothetical protein